MSQFIILLRAFLNLWETSRCLEFPNTQRILTVTTLATITAHFGQMLPRPKVVAPISKSSNPSICFYSSCSEQGFLSSSRDNVLERLYLFSLSMSRWSVVSQRRPNQTMNIILAFEDEREAFRSVIRIPG